MLHAENMHSPAAHGWKIASIKRAWRNIYVLAIHIAYLITIHIIYLLPSTRNEPCSCYFPLRKYTSWLNGRSPSLYIAYRVRWWEKAIIYKKLNGTTSYALVIMLLAFSYLMYCVMSWGNHNTKLIFISSN